MPLVSPDAGRLKSPLHPVRHDLSAKYVDERPVPFGTAGYSPNDAGAL